MEGFNVNADMFGLYAWIPTGYSKGMHIYKVVSHFKSNSYCEVPITYNSVKVNHGSGLEDVLNVIHCGIDETKVIRVALKDCKIFKAKPKTNADRIRNMTDEELAEIIMCPEGMGDECEREGGHCITCSLAWLRQTVGD